MSKTKVVTVKQLRQKKIKELHQLLSQNQQTKEQNQMAIITKRSKDTNLVKKDKKAIARIKTVLAEKKELEKLAVAQKELNKK